MLDLVARRVAGDHERHEREPGRERRHEDRREPLERAAHDQLRAEGLALEALEVLEVVDHEDAVARGDAEDGEEPDQRADREDPVGAEHDGQQTADERHRQSHEREDRQPPAAERGLQQQEDPDRGGDAEEDHVVLRVLALLVLAEQLGVVAEREVDVLRAAP